MFRCFGCFGPPRAGTHKHDASGFDPSGAGSIHGPAYSPPFAVSQTSSPRGARSSGAFGLCQRLPSGIALEASVKDGAAFLLRSPPSASAHSASTRGDALTPRSTTCASPAYMPTHSFGASHIHPASPGSAASLPLPMLLGSRPLSPVPAMGLPTERPPSILDITRRSRSRPGSFARSVPSNSNLSLDARGGSEGGGQAGFPSNGGSGIAGVSASGIEGISESGGRAPPSPSPSLPHSASAQSMATSSHLLAPASPSQRPSWAGQLWGSGPGSPSPSRPARNKLFSQQQQTANQRQRIQLPPSLSPIHQSSQQASGTHRLQAAAPSSPDATTSRTEADAGNSRPWLEGTHASPPSAFSRHLFLSSTSDGGSPGSLQLQLQEARARSCSAHNGAHYTGVALGLRAPDGQTDDAPDASDGHLSPALRSPRGSLTTAAGAAVVGSLGTWGSADVGAKYLAGSFMGHIIGEEEGEEVGGEEEEGSQPQQQWEVGRVTGSTSVLHRPLSLSAVPQLELHVSNSCRTSDTDRPSDTNFDVSAWAAAAAAVAAAAVGHSRPGSAGSHTSAGSFGVTHHPRSHLAHQSSLGPGTTGMHTPPLSRFHAHMRMSLQGNRLALGSSERLSASSIASSSAGCSSSHTTPGNSTGRHTPQGTGGYRGLLHKARSLTVRGPARGGPGSLMAKDRSSTPGGGMGGGGIITPGGYYQSDAHSSILGPRLSGAGARGERLSGSSMSSMVGSGAVTPRSTYRQGGASFDVPAGPPPEYLYLAAGASPFARQGGALMPGGAIHSAAGARSRLSTSGVPGPVPMQLALHQHHHQELQPALSGGDGQPQTQASHAGPTRVPGLFSHVSARAGSAGLNTLPLQVSIADLESAAIALELVSTLGDLPGLPTAAGGSCPQVMGMTGHGP